MEKKASLSFVFILFIIVYSVSASSWELPYSNVLRWVVMGLLLFSAILVNKKFYLSFPFFWLICAFTLGLVVSIGRDNFMVGLERMASYFMLIIAMYSYFTIGENDSKTISKAICSFAVILEILAVLLTGYFFVSGGTFGKYMAIYGNQNYLAPIACTMSAMSLLMFFRAKEGFTKIIHGICFICSTFLVLATGSRGGLLSFLAIIVLFPLMVSPELNFTSFLKQIIIIAVVIAVIYLLLKVIDIPALDRMFGKKNDTSSTGLSRGETWETGIKLFLVKPVFGWGSSATYQYVYVKNTS
ncbi:MAG: O-antigen ligase family protein, partial [Clostridia bacterium]|nr:O-antigen ligase family protein [Clostridia bacterium]